MPLRISFARVLFMLNKISISFDRILLCSSINFMIFISCSDDHDFSSAIRRFSVGFSSVFRRLSKGNCFSLNFFLDGRSKIICKKFADSLTQINWKIQISKNKIQINYNFSNIQIPNKQFRMLTFYHCC